MISALTLLCAPSVAGAQEAKQQPAPSTKPADDPAHDDDIVVTARRYGEAKVVAETEFSEAQITAQGADSIEELVTRLTLFIGNGADEPILLINGRPADGDRSILSYPAEALNRLAVLKPEAAAQYGYASGKRVVNLVLKQTFASVDADASVSGATAGGQHGGSLSAGRVAIDGPTRWNVQARIERQSALSRSARDIPPDEPAPDVQTIGPDDFETLLPSRRSMSFNAGVDRPLGSFSASLSVNGNSNASSGLRRPPPGSALSPAGERGLRNDNNAQSLGAAFTLSGRIADWQTSFAANYARTWSDGLLDLAYDSLMPTIRNRSRGENINARLNVSKTVVDLPAGPLTSNISVDVSRNRFVNRNSDTIDDPVTVDARTRGQTNGQVSFSVPLSRRGEGEIWSLGDLSVDLFLGAQTQSDSGLQKRFGGGVNWSPFSILQLRGSLDYAETAPSFDQLDGPLVTTINRIFDFARQETVDIVSINGGNPDLRRGSRQGLSLTARLLPLDDQTLALDVGYRSQTANGGLAGFPALTPVIEAAFPERVTRGADGRLIAIDARAINIAKDASAELASGIALRLPRQSGALFTANPWQFSVSLNHRWRLKDELLTRSGVPVIDRLSGDGGQSRHFLTLQATAGKRGVGASLSGNWSGAARVRTPADVGSDFRFKPAATFDLSAFVEPEHILSNTEESPWIKNVKLSLDIQNLLNGYRRVTLGDDSVPLGYSRYEIEPLGRTMRLTVRKRF